MGRWLERLVRAQDRWAGPLGDFNHRWLSALFRPLGPVKDWLNGSWLGHPLHPAVTDVPVGALFVAVVLDLLGQSAAADIALVATILFMVAAAVTGAADYVDTDGSARVRASLHSALMVVALVLLVISLGIRASNPTDRTVPVVLSIIGFLIVAAGAYVGGDVVYVFGNMVSRHAFRGAGGKWLRLGHRRRGRPRDPPGGDAGQGEGRGQRSCPRSHRRYRPRPARRVLPCRRAADPGQVRRWLHRMPLARQPFPLDRWPRSARSGPVRPARIRDPRSRFGRVTRFAASRRSRRVIGRRQ